MESPDDERIRSCEDLSYSGLFSRFVSVDHIPKDSTCQKTARHTQTALYANDHTTDDFSINTH